MSIAIAVLLGVLIAAPEVIGAQPERADSPPPLRARHLLPAAQVKVFVPAGSLRLMGWDRDSIVVRGRIGRGERFYFAGSDSAIKLGIEERAESGAAASGDLVIYLPRRSRLAVRTVSADIAARDASGWFYTVSGSVRLEGSASSLDVLSMTGAVDLDVATPWVRARTGDGQLLLRGAPLDADVSTITGALDVATPAVLRGQFATVSGDIRYSGSAAAGAILDFSSHSGTVDLVMRSDASARLALSTVAGAIENGFADVRPVAATARSLSLTLGAGDASLTVRTYKGPIRLRVR